MAWTTPTSYSTGQILTAAGLNTQLVDNLKSLRGLNDKAVKVVLDVSDVTIANATLEPGTVISWQGSVWNIGSMWSSAANASRITPGEIGYYHVNGVTVWQDNASGLRVGDLYRDGTTVREPLYRVPGMTGTIPNQVQPFTADIFVSSTTQYWTLGLRQNSGAGLDVRSGSISRSCLSFRLIGST